VVQHENGCRGEQWVDGGEGAFQFYSARDFFSGEREDYATYNGVFFIIFERLVGEREAAVIFWFSYYKKRGGGESGGVGWEDAGRKGFDEGSLHCDS
jgi:hypothetical protein